MQASRHQLKAHLRSQLIDQRLSQTVVSRRKLPQHRDCGRIVADNQQVLKRSDQLRLLGRDDGSKYGSHNTEL